MTELERFRMTRAIVAVPFAFNLFMVVYFLTLSFFLLLGAEPFSSDSVLWQLLTALPPISFAVNGLSLPLLIYALRQDISRQPQSEEIEGDAGRTVLWNVFLIAGFVCTGMLYIFVFIPTLLGMIAGTI